MLEINTANIKRLEKHSIIKIPKNKKFAGYKFIIPNKFITSSNSFVKVINLPLETTIKIKKDNDIKQITLGDLK